MLESSLKTEMTARILKIESVLKDALDCCAETEPAPPALMAPVIELLGRGGKRWRPLLMSLLCEALGGKERALPFSALIEFAHNASLIHDDIEDNSKKRRGEDAIHIIYGVDAAINSGSFLYFLPFLLIDKMEAEGRDVKNTLYSLYARNLRRLHTGQALDISWHKGGFVPRFEDYYAMCARKTGVLSGFAAELAVLAAGLERKRSFNPAFSEKMRAAGENLGVGFQILDDVKNLTEGVPGKERGDDIVEGKMSLPALFFLRGGSEGEVNGENLVFLQQCFNAAGKGGAGVKEAGLLIKALEKSGAIKKARKEGERLVKKSIMSMRTAAGRSAAGKNDPAVKNALALLEGFAPFMLGEGVVPLTPHP